MKKSQTKYRKLANLKDSEIDFSDIRELTPKDFAKSIVRKGLVRQENKKMITIRVDASVLSWYRKLGKGYQTRISELLKAYKEESEQHRVAVHK